MQIIPLCRVSMWYNSNFLQIYKCSPMLTSIAYCVNGDWNILYDIVQPISEVINNKISDNEILQKIATNNIKIDFGYILLFFHEFDVTSNSLLKRVKNYDQEFLDNEYLERKTLKCLLKTNIMIIVIFNSNQYTEEMLKESKFINYIQQIFPLFRFYSVKQKVSTFKQDIASIITNDDNIVKLSFLIFYQMNFLSDFLCIDVGNVNYYRHITQFAIENTIVFNMYCIPPMDVPHTSSCLSNTVDNGYTLISAPYSDDIWNGICDMINDILIIGNKNISLMIQLFNIMLKSKQDNVMLYVKSILNDDRYKILVSICNNKFINNKNIIVKNGIRFCIQV